MGHDIFNELATHYRRMANARTRNADCALPRHRAYEPGVDTTSRTWYCDDTMQTYTQQTESIMNEDQELLNLLQEERGIVTVKVAHTKTIGDAKEGALYTYKTDMILSEGEYVVVNNVNGLATAKVIKVDIGIDLTDADKFRKMQWVVSKIDVDKMAQIEKSEQETLAMLRKQRARKRLREVASDLQLDEIVNSMAIGRDPATAGAEYVPSRPYATGETAQADSPGH